MESDDNPEFTLWMSFNPLTMADWGKLVSTVMTGRPIVDVTVFSETSNERVFEP